MGTLRETVRIYVTQQGEADSDMQMRAQVVVYLLVVLSMARQVRMY